jgi:hypothetical protein
VSWVGLTLGIGGEGARMTSRMFFGGWLYPDAFSGAVAAAELTFDADGSDCAAMGTDVPQATRAPAKKQCKAFRTGISSLRFRSLAKTSSQDDADAGDSNRPLAENLTWVELASQRKPWN